MDFIVGDPKEDFKKILEKYKVLPNVGLEESLTKLML